MYKTLLIITIILFAYACNNTTKEKTNNTQQENLIPFKLSNKTIIFKSYKTGNSKIIYFNLHDDENTSVQAAKQVLTQIKAQLIEIQASGKRLIDFEIDTINYKFDPNRIFTPIGRKATLERYSQYSPQADSIVKSFAHYITDTLLADAKIIVALHNNTPDNYSIVDYAKGGKYQNDAAEVYINKKQDPDDFFYVTEKYFFDKIKNKEYNVLLQNNNNVNDDGSLSVYCGKKGIKYINIEAQKKHLQQQKEMILSIQEIIDNK